jgi:hypothetical protein
MHLWWWTTHALLLRGGGGCCLGLLVLRKRVCIVSPSLDIVKLSFEKTLSSTWETSSYKFLGVSSVVPWSRAIGNKRAGDRRIGGRMAGSRQVSRVTCKNSPLHFLFRENNNHIVCSFRWFIVVESTVRWFVVREKHCWMAADSADKSKRTRMFHLGPSTTFSWPLQFCRSIPDTAHKIATPDARRACVQFHAGVVYVGFRRSPLLLLNF